MRNENAECRNVRALALLLCALLALCVACGQAEPEPITSATESPITTLEVPAVPPVEIEPISHTVTKRIHPGKREFAFIVEGVLRREFSLNVNGEPYSSEYNVISAIDIWGENGAFRQRLEGFETRFPYYPDDYGLLFADFNNDGYLDLQLYAFIGGTSTNVPSFFWLWDNKQGKFTRNQQLEELSDGNYVSMDGSRVHCFARGGAAYRYNSWYEYRSGAFIQVESLEEELCSEDDALYVHSVIKKLIDGRMQTVSDMRENLEEGSEAP